MSIVQICNRGASQYLGLPTVNSLQEGTPQSEQYVLHYNDLRRSLLEKHWWIFAKKRIPLSLTTNDRPDEWLYRYQRPAKVIDIHWINDPRVASALIARHENPDSHREDIGQFTYSNVPQAYIQYTDDLEETELMPQYFRDALSAMIASAVALPLTESVERARFAGQQAEALIDIAIAEDESNTPAIETPEADYINARTGGFGYHDGDDLNNNFRRY